MNDVFCLMKANNAECKDLSKTGSQNGVTLVGSTHE